MKVTGRETQRHKDAKSAKKLLLNKNLQELVVNNLNLNEFYLIYFPVEGARGLDYSVFKKTRFLSFTAPKSTR